MRSLDRMKLIIAFCSLVAPIFAQNTYDSTMVLALDSVRAVHDSTDRDKDIKDVFRNMRHKKPKLHLTTTKKEHLQFTLVPAAGYTLQTGFTILLAANTVFYTDKDDHSKSSTILASIAYTQYNQIILPLFVNVWTKGKKYNIISDIRYMSYPSQTFGLGAKTEKSGGYDIDFSYVKIHQSILKRISSDLFAGVGYYYDFVWNQEELNPPSGTTTSFQDYGLHRKETASGLSFQVLFDNRANQVNPTAGSYASLRYRVNNGWMGSTTGWQSGVLDLRKYVQFPKNSSNTIALWNFNWTTLQGKPPYLLLPSTGWDDYFNTGRGYIQGRYRAKNMSYLEAEYRFRLVANGLFGAVIFGNLQTFSSEIADLYQVVVSGGGAGLRIKINKRSNTNLCIDYGFGKDGSRGFFINLGEVF